MRRASVAQGRGYFGGEGWGDHSQVVVEFNAWFEADE